MLSLFHWTPNTFKDFAYGDVGFHIGTINASLDRRTSKHISQRGKDIVKELYVNAKKPILLEDCSWDAQDVAFQLWENGIISEQTRDEIYYLKGAIDGDYLDDAIGHIKEQDEILAIIALFRVLK